jgi:hypothetical protein
MSEFLETLRRGLQEAHQKFQAAQQKQTGAQSDFQGAQQRLSVAQAEFNQAAQEFQAFQTLVNLQTRKEQAASGTSPAATNGPATIITPAAVIHQRPVLAHPQPRVITATVVSPTSGQISTTQAASTTVSVPVSDNKTDINKTQAVRDLLRQHPNGISPVDIWKALGTQLSNRAYLYSVLKRLRDKGDAKEKRGKYYFAIKAEEAQEPEMHPVVQ